MSYYPQWKARAAAKALLGDDGTAWSKGGWYFIGLRHHAGKVPFGKGRSWVEAIANAKNSNTK